MGMQVTVQWKCDECGKELETHHNTPRIEWGTWRPIFRPYGQSWAGIYCSDECSHKAMQKLDAKRKIS